MLSAFAVTSYGSKNKKNKKISLENRIRIVLAQKVIFVAFENATEPMTGGEIRRLKLNPGTFYCISYGMAAGKYQVLRIQRGKEKSIS